MMNCMASGGFPVTRYGPFSVTVMAIWFPSEDDSWGDAVFLPYRMRILSRFVTLPLQELFLTEFLLSEESEISCFSKNVEVNFAKIRPCSDRTCLFCMWFVLSLPKMGCGSAILRTSLHDYSRLSVSLTSWSLDRMRFGKPGQVPVFSRLSLSLASFGCFGFGQTQIKLLLH